MKRINFTEEEIKSINEALAEAEEENSWITFEELKEHLDKRVEEDMKKIQIAT